MKGMNSISIDNEKYVKATDIARELGYTADYVGQLCRSKKVEAQLVGRSWYVLEGSIHEHKKTRYRSTKAASKATVSRSLETEAENGDTSFQIDINKKETPTHRKIRTGYAQESFYGHSVKKKKHTYFEDDSELMPVSKTKAAKTGHLPVTLAGSKRISIKSKSNDYDFTPQERPELVFSGSLTVVDADEYPEDTKPEVEKQNTDQLTEAPDVAEVENEEVTEQGVTHIHVTHRRNKKRKKRKLPFEHNMKGVVGMTRGGIADRNPIGGTLQIVSDTSSPDAVRYSIILGTFVLAAVLAVAFMSLESVTSIDNEGMSSSYLFQVQKLFEWTENIH